MSKTLRQQTAVEYAKQEQGDEPTASAEPCSAEAGERRQHATREGPYFWAAVPTGQSAVRALGPSCHRFQMQLMADLIAKTAFRDDQRSD